MAETAKEEVDEETEVNDLPEWDEDAKESLKNDGEHMESPVKQKGTGLMKSFRTSFKKVASPMKNKKPEYANNGQSQSLNPQLQPLHSPSKCLQVENILVFEVC